MVQVTGEREGWTLIPGLTELFMNQAWPVAHLYPSMQKADGPYRLWGPSQVGPALEGQLWSQGPSGGFTGDRATAAPPKLRLQHLLCMWCYLPMYACLGIQTQKAKNTVFSYDIAKKA
jgi:hypothetical protein